MNNFRRREGEGINNNDDDFIVGAIRKIEYLPREDMHLEFDSSTVGYRGAERLLVALDIYKKSGSEYKYYTTLLADVSGLRAIRINKALNKIVADSLGIEYNLKDLNENISYKVYASYSMSGVAIYKTDPDGTKVVDLYSLRVYSTHQVGYTSSGYMFKVTFTKQGAPGEGNVLVQFSNM